MKTYLLIIRCDSGPEKIEVRDSQDALITYCQMYVAGKIHRDEDGAFLVTITDGILDFNIEELRVDEAQESILLMVKKNLMNKDFPR